MNLNVRICGERESPTKYVNSAYQIHKPYTRWKDCGLFKKDKYLQEWIMVFNSIFYEQIWYNSACKLIYALKNVDSLPKIIL